MFRKSPTLARAAVARRSSVLAGGVRRRWLALGFLLVALGVAGCGSSGSGTTSSSSEPASKPASTQETKNGIPQGEHAGDGDGDNHGEPSDGDGNI
jgi:hypothetical protein